MEEGWLGEKVGCSNKEGAICRERESCAAVFRDIRRRLERESFGEWRGG